MDSRNQQHPPPVGQRRAADGGFLSPAGQRRVADGGLLRPAGQQPHLNMDRLDQLQAANNNPYLDTADPYFQRAMDGVPVANLDDLRGRSQLFHRGIIRDRAGYSNVQGMENHFVRGYNSTVDMANRGMSTFQNTDYEVGRALSLLEQVTPILLRVRQDNQQQMTYFQSSMSQQRNHRHHRQYFAHSNSHTMNANRFADLDRQCAELLSSTYMAAPTPPTAEQRAPLALGSNPQEDIGTPSAYRPRSNGTPSRRRNNVGTLSSSVKPSRRRNDGNRLGTGTTPNRHGMLSPTTLTWKQVKGQVVQDFKSGLVGLDATTDDFFVLEDRNYSSVHRPSFTKGLKRLRSEVELWNEIVEEAANSEN